MRKRIAISSWSWLFLLLNLGFLFLFSALQRHVDHWQVLCLLLWILPFSRINEIVYAFYNDSLERMERQKPRSGLTRIQRFKLLGRSYFEIAVCYGSLYLALPDKSFVRPPATGFESLYFSWITITTTGFGDITPSGVLARILCMTEVGLGLMLLVFAVGSYFSYEE